MRKSDAFDSSTDKQHMKSMLNDLTSRGESHKRKADDLNDENNNDNYELEFDNYWVEFCYSVFKNESVTMFLNLLKLVVVLYFLIITCKTRKYIRERNQIPGNDCKFFSLFTFRREFLDFGYILLSAILY